MGTRIPLTTEELAKAAQTAVDKADDPISSTYDQLNESRNLTLLLFFKELKRTLIAKGENTVWTQTLAKATRGVQALCYRPWDDATLVACKGIGKSLVKLVREHLWTLEPADPPDAEDMANYEAYIAGEKAKEAQAKEQSRAAKAAATSGASTAALGRIQGQSAEAQSHNPSAALDGCVAGGQQQVERATKRARKAPAGPKQYLPKPNTANWALLVALLKAHREGESFLSKEPLIDRAEATGLSNKPIRSNGGPPQGGGRGFGYQDNPAAYYSGWSNMKKLLNTDPPYVLKWSNPAKFKLTPEGQHVAEQLYLNSIQRGQLMEPMPLDLLQRHPQFAQAGAGSCTAPMPAGAAAGPAHLPAPSGNLPGPTTSAGTLHIADAAGSPQLPNHLVSQLCDMGYSRQQAVQALQGGRTVQEACELLMLAEEEDEDAFPQLSQSLHGPSLSTLPPQHSARARLLADAESQPTGFQHGSFAPLAPAGPIVQAGPAGGPARGPGGPPATLRSQRLPGGLLPDPTSSLLGPVPPRAGAASTASGVLTRLPSNASQSTSGVSVLGGLEPCTPNDWKMDTMPARESLQRILACQTMRLPPLQPGNRFVDEYDVVLCIDIREQFGNSVGGGAGCGRRTTGLQSQVERLQRMGSRCETRKLEIADALWLARHRSTGAEYCLDYAAERKNVFDLAQSIKDNRYTRQKLTMQQCGLRHLCYIVEGRVQEYSSLGPSEQQAVKTATAASMVQDGFKVLRTEDVHCTARLYHDMTQFLVRLYGPRSIAPGPEGEQLLPSFQGFSERVKQHSSRKEWTVTDVWGAMLATVRGISTNVADAMTAAHPTPKAMADQYTAAVAGKQDAVQAAEQALAGLHIDQTRKVSALQSKIVYNHFFFR